MKIEWNKKKSGNKRSRSTISTHPNLPFDQPNEHDHDPTSDHKTLNPSASSSNPDFHLADSFQSQGNKLAEDGRFREALGKWEAALTLAPERAVLHEQKAQVLLEIGDAWNALKAASRATELEPSWAEAWITLARAQLNFGEPDASIESFDKALAIKPNSEEAHGDRETALQLVKRRKQLHISGASTSESRYTVGDSSEIS
eukprot:TRINITY_DN16426_c0_g2_i1.p1 TRINITY_DN16426_c0_g2~~TRINITY_DN16426_c0_g2_i1.p1  ORF type:complete len:201 (-),score=36.94 TRINITY_DN16426_c0_g2_i1:106-708(-)